EIQLGETTLKLNEWLTKVRRSHYVKDILKLAFTMVGLLPTRKKTIVFESFLGKQYSDNPKALYLHIKKHYPDYTLYWSVDRGKVRDFETRGFISCHALG